MPALHFDRLSIQKKLLDHYIQDGFENDDDLIFYVKEFLGFEYPKKAFCSHHDAPSQIMCDAFFERVSFLLLWANRTGGKTQLVALLNHLDSMFRGPLEIVTAGAALDQSHKGYQYFLKSFEHPLLKPYIGNSIQSRTDLTNQSSVQIITGSYKGFNGPHPAKVRIDEVELMEWLILEEGLNMSKSTKTARAQDVLSSTRKFSRGTVQRLLDEKDERGLSVKSYCIWDIVERCERECHGDKKYGDCPIYHLCSGKAHEGMGWYPIHDLIKKGMNLTKSTFEAQWENKRPSDAPLVYGEYFDRDKHVRSWDDLYKIFKVPEFKKHQTPAEWTHVAGVDFGTNFAFLIFAIEPTTRTWIQVYEYFCTIDRRLVEHRNIFTKADSYQHLGPIFADSAAKQDRIELRSMGVPCRESIKGPGSILLGIDEVKLQLQTNSVLDRPKFFIVDGVAPNTVREFESWGWEMNDDGTPNTEKPLDSDNHAMDALRYAIFSLGRTGARYDSTYVEGV